MKFERGVLQRRAAPWIGGEVPFGVNEPRAEPGGPRHEDMSGVNGI